MFIGREKELKFLNERYESSKAELIFLYGRRRVGKTCTLLKFCEDKENVFFSCQECPDALQLKKFSQIMLKQDIQASQYISEFKDWEQAFLSVLELPHKGKKLLVIDEFPYMCKNNPSIPSILQNLWDNTLQNSNVMIILCGSAMSFIEKELLAYKNPLYGRATGIYKMKEMNFYDAIKFFPNYSNEDKIMAYSILGGIPHYLKQFDANLSIEENIKKNILNNGCVLYNEVEYLLHQELREISIYNSIIEAVALGNTKLSEISQKTMIDNSSKTSVYLKNLEELEIMERQLSIDAGQKERSNSHRGIYQLTDNYFKFWYTYVLNNITYLEEGDVDGIYKYEIEPTLNQFASRSFEDVCRQFLIQQQINNKLPFRFEKIGRWFGKTTIHTKDNTPRIGETEIDILAISVKEKSYLVGECKFKESSFSYSEYLDMQAKLAGLKKDNTFYYALFSKNGFDEKIKNINDPHLLLFNLDDLFIE